MNGECVIWSGYVNPAGYGVKYVKNRAVNAHRIAYEEAYGPIPDGLHIDHLCRNRACVNPEHLEAVSIKENVMRGFGPPAMNARKTHCIRGHPLDRVQPDGKRYCKTCKAMHTAEWRARRKEVNNR